MRRRLQHVILALLGCLGSSTQSARAQPHPQPHPLLELGERKIADGDARGALADLKQALDRYRDEPAVRARVLVAMARAYETLKERTQAMTALDMILRDGPESFRSQAQFLKGRIEGRDLLSPAKLLDILRRFSLESPITLDFDLVRYLVGYQTGYRLDEVGLSLELYARTWKDFPRGPWAPHALLHQGLVEGFLLYKPRLAANRFRRIIRQYPGTAPAPTATLALGVLALSDGEHSRALDLLAAVAEGPERLPARFLEGLILAYFTSRPGESMTRFEQLIRGEDRHYRDVGWFHQAFVAFAALKDPGAARDRLSRLLGGTPGSRGPDPALHEQARQLEVYVRRVMEVPPGPGRDLEYALFWYANHHYTRARQELAGILERVPRTPQAQRARFLLGKIAQEDIPDPETARAVLSGVRPSEGNAAPELAWRQTLAAAEGSPEERARLEAIRADPQSPFRHLAGVEMASRGWVSRPEELDRIEDEVRQEPSGEVRSRLLARLARYYGEGGSPRRALELYQEALAYDAGLLEATHRARRSVRATDLEARLEAERTFEGRTPDPLVWLELARLYTELDREDDAREALRRILKLEGEDPATVQAREEARLEDVLLKVRRSRFPTQALRYLEEYAAGLPASSPRRHAAMAERVRLLEGEPEPARQEERLELMRELVDAGIDAGQHTLELARRALDERRWNEALDWLDKVRYTGEESARALELRARSHDGLKDRQRALDAYRLLAQGHPATPQGEAAGRVIATRLAEEVEQRLQETSDPREVAAAILAFLDALDPAWAGSIPGFLDKLGSDPYLGRLDPVVLDRLIRLHEQADLDRTRLARLHGRAAALAPRDRRRTHLLEQARALLDAGSPRRAVEILESELADDPRGMLLVASILRTRYEDAAAARRVLERLLGHPGAGAPELVWAYLDLAELTAAGPPGPRTPEAVLDEGIGRLALPAALPLVERKVRRLKDGGRVREAGELLVGAARDVTDINVVRRVTLAAVKLLMEAGAHAAASEAVGRLTRRGFSLSFDPELAMAFKRSEALVAIARLEAGLDWDDPENPRNRMILLNIARLDVSPLRRFEEAFRVLAQIDALSGTQGPEVTRPIREEIATRVKLRPLEEKDEKTSRELMELANDLELQLGDHQGATFQLEKLIEIYPTAPEAPLARLKLVRLYSLDLDQRDRAKEALAGLDAAGGTPAALEPERAAIHRLVDSQPEYRALLFDLSRALAQKSTTLVVFEKLGRMAVTEYKDPALAHQIVEKLLVVDAVDPLPARRRLAFDIAYNAAVQIPPTEAVLHVAPAQSKLLARATELAPDAVAASRIGYAWGRRFELDGALPDAALSYRRSLDASRGTPWEKETLYRLARIHELQGELEPALASYEELARVASKDPYQEVATRRVPLVRRLIRSSGRDRALVEGSRPEDYYEAARHQMEEDEDDDRALANYRTYLRLGRDREKLVESHFRSAEILLRTDRPREAVDMLQKLLERFPNHPRRAEALYRMGQAYESGMANYLDARDHYRRAVKIRPQTRWTREADTGLIRVREVLADLDERLRTREGVSVEEDLRSIREKYIKEKGSYEEALAAIRSQLEATTSAEDRARLYREMGIIHEQELDNPAEAVEAYEKFLEESKDEVERGDVTLRIARIRADRLADPEGAQEMLNDFQTAHYRHPRRIDALLLLAELKEKKLDDTQGALNIYRNIANSFPRSGYDESALLRIADISRRQFADFTSAIEALRRIVRDFPFSTNAPFAQLTIANIFETELGDLQSAAQEYQRLIEAYPQSAYADGARQALIRLRAR